jgi:hypothetical protein
LTPVDPKKARRILDPQLARRAEYLAEVGRWDVIAAEQLEHYLPRRLSPGYQRLKSSLADSFERAERRQSQKRR